MFMHSNFVLSSQFHDVYVNRGDISVSALQSVNGVKNSDKIDITVLAVDYESSDQSLTVEMRVKSNERYSSFTKQSTLSYLVLEFCYSN